MEIPSSAFTNFPSSISSTAERSIYFSNTDMDIETSSNDNSSSSSDTITAMNSNLVKRSKGEGTSLHMNIDTTISNNDHDGCSSSNIVSRVLSGKLFGDCLQTSFDDDGKRRKRFGIYSR